MNLRLYVKLLGSVQGDVALEEMVRGPIESETEHIEEVEKMTKVIDR